MNIVYYRCEERNFGDDLNQWLWPRLIPQLESALPTHNFIGVGTILDSRVPPNKPAVILGTGYRPSARPLTISPLWSFYGVRGKLTAAALALDPSLAIGDPAHAIATFDEFDGSGKRESVGIVPHLSTIRVCGDLWHKAVSDSGHRLISPCQDAASVIDQIVKCDRIVTESLHGAVIADTFRIPWLAVRSTSQFAEGEVNNFKWQDWMSCLDVDAKRYGLPILWSGERRRLSERIKHYAKINVFKYYLNKMANSTKFSLTSDCNHRKRLEAIQTAVESLAKDLREGHVRGLVG